MNLNTPPIKSGQITEAEFNSMVSEPWVIPHMHTEEGFAQVNVRREPVSLETQVLRILKWLGIVLVVASVVALGVKGVM